jgi:hypothetical protein
MATKSRSKAQAGQNRNSTRVSIYSRQGTQLRKAIDREAQTNAVIVEMLRKACRICPNLTATPADAP